ncbi:hypothetical protein ACS0TY_004739 [Phlomoides rotata]
MSSCSSFSNAPGSLVSCDCGMEARIRTSWTKFNPGRRFYGCRAWRVNGGGCSFFQWADDEMSDRAKTVILNLLQENKKYKDVKTENEHPGGNLMAYALVGSWVFFIAMWLSVHK